MRTRTLLRREVHFTNSFFFTLKARSGCQYARSMPDDVPRVLMRSNFFILMRSFK